jgi:phosphate starvation-inducible PhoH-like protein
LNPPQGKHTTDTATRPQVTLEFKNALLPALAGSHSRHLVRLEQRLGVRIAMRGNLIAIEGEPDAREQAAAVLRALYGRLEAGEEIALGDVDAEIGFTAAASHEPSRVKSNSTLRTAAGKITRARSAAQVAYI